MFLVAAVKVVGTARDFMTSIVKLNSFCTSKPGTHDRHALRLVTRSGEFAMQSPVWNRIECSGGFGMCQMSSTISACIAHATKVLGIWPLRVS